MARVVLEDLVAGVAGAAAGAGAGAAVGVVAGEAVVVRAGVAVTADPAATVPARATGWWRTSSRSTAWPKS